MSSLKHHAKQRMQQRWMAQKAIIKFTGFL